MIKNIEYKIGSLITFKKQHPSKTIEWKVIRVGADIKVQSTLKEDVFIMMERHKFNRKVQKVVKY